MSKEIYISSTPHETRLAIVENDDLTEIYYERENEYTLAGSIYNGKVTRVLPGMQSSFVDVGLERDAFLYITDFMEEAGESAEFDSTDGANGSRRGHRDDRGAREDAPVAQSDTQDRLSAPVAEARPERADREGGRRRRGNRDGRNGARDNGDVHSGSRAQGADLRPSSQNLAEPTPETPGLVDSGYAAPDADGSSADLGEGAPGADGSRRWRGRRGRRRGRSSVQREESQVLQQPDAAGSPTDNYSDEPETLEEDFDTEYADSFDVNAAAAPSAQPPVNTATIPGSTPLTDPHDRGRRDRGDRGPRDRNRRDRGDRDQRTPRAPRGFAPSRELYGVDSSAELKEDDTDGPAPEPMILPGESLSKYRKGEPDTASSGSAAASQSIPVVKPATEFTLRGAWDGGNVLPGETLRPRSNAGASTGSQERSRQDRKENDRGSRDHRNDRRDRGDRNRSDFSKVQPTPPSFGQVPVATSEASPSQTTQATASAFDPHLEAGHEPLPESTLHHVPQTPQETAPAANEHVASAEYEPVERSASVRFDAAKVSEFRQSAPPAEDLFPEEAEPIVNTASHDIERSRTSHSIAHTITPQPEASVEPIHATTAEESPSAHEFTAIHNTGEMISDAAMPTPQEIAEPTSPMHHETAVFESTAQSEGTVETPAGLLESSAAGHQEDFNATTLHASSIEEMDYEDDETLEGAADLGTMIREMSIDQITRPGEDQDDEEDEDIVEEEYAVDDEHHEAYEDAEEVDEEDEDPVRSVGSSEADLGDHFLQASPADQQDAEGSRFDGGHAPVSGQESTRDPERRFSRRDGGRRDSRRDGRSRDRGGDRARSTGGSGDRSTSRPGRRDGRHSAQTTNLPAISDLLKPGQEVLVQIAKEPIAKKGARITSHIALPGRFLVFMPTVNHTGVSRKIESDSERRRLKEILLSEKGDASGGFIVRTAASGASEEELRSDLRFLLNLWADIKQRSESSKSPALIYHDLNLVERVLRDQVTDTFSAIWVDTETEYERVLRFLQRFQPSLIRRVKLYTKETPLFEQFGITEEINKALRSKVWLKSGGSIVINQTEALVAIDINTGKYVGKTARLEDTIVKTNLDAIPEIVRQIRLRDLGGIIIIDFIDMDERRNRHKVMAALEEELKKDRAPSKVLQFNDFGLVAITRKRVKQSLERTLSTTCNVCQGTGMTKSPVTVCNDIYIEIRKMQKHLDRGDVMLRVHPEVVKQLKAGGTKWLQEMEEIVGKTILVKSDPSLHPEQFDIH